MPAQNAGVGAVMLRAFFLLMFYLGARCRQVAVRLPG